MKRVKVTSAIFLIFVGVLYLNSPGCYRLCELLKEAINWANLTINYCFCQAFSHWECGWQGPLYIAIHTILSLGWCYKVVKAKRSKVRRRMERQKRKERVELRVLRLIAWLNDGYPQKSPKLNSEDAAGEEEEPPGQ